MRGSKSKNGVHIRKICFWVISFIWRAEKAFTGDNTSTVQYIMKIGVGASTAITLHFWGEKLVEIYHKVFFTLWIRIILLLYDPTSWASNSKWKEASVSGIFRQMTWGWRACGERVGLPNCMWRKGAGPCRPIRLYIEGAGRRFAMKGQQQQQAS